MGKSSTAFLLALIISSHLHLAAAPLQLIPTIISLIPYIVSFAKILAVVVGVASAGIAAIVMFRNILASLDSDENHDLWESMFPIRVKIDQQELSSN
jgi:hypothetical protein